MKFVLFYHSLVSDWNHGNAHFLRGIATELLARGHQVRVLEPRESWSVKNLLAEHGRRPVRQFHAVYPGLRSMRYKFPGLDLREVLRGVDVVLVHEWNDAQLIKAVGEHHRHMGGYTLFFHDTHHRMVTAPETMAAYDLSAYDGVLAYGRVLQRMYERSGRVERAWTWHEAADTRVFRPHPQAAREADLAWIGNWGDGERTAELDEFLMRPCRQLKLRAQVFGVRYPECARKALAEAGIEYGGWLPNFEVPQVLAQHRMTVHVPRRPYVAALPGIPTIRPFEALACGMPLVCSPWDDAEGLFTPGRDFVVARNGEEMKETVKELLAQEKWRAELGAHGLETIQRRHTCAHRVDELLAIAAQVRPSRVALASGKSRPKAEKASRSAAAPVPTAG